MLSRDRDSMPRTWTGDEDIRAITREARLAVLTLDIFSAKQCCTTSRVSNLMYIVYP